jgi:diguanylate cyclase (GGDEF)-like protein/PAS domain S-box-containing protein/putative nucleotidyltransferase with HDIG domain
MTDSRNAATPSMATEVTAPRFTAHQVVVFLYIAAVALAGGAVATVTVVRGPDFDPLPVALFCLGAGVAEWIKVSIDDDSPVAVSLSLSVIVAAMVTFGPGGATLCGLSAVAVPAVLRQHRPQLRKVLFNAGLFSLAAGLGALTYQWLGGGLSGPVRPYDFLVAMVGAGVYMVVNWTLLIGVVRLTTGRTIREIWSEDLQWLPVQIMAGAALGFALGASYRLLGWLGAAIYLAPLVAIRESMWLYTSRVHAANAKLVDANQTLDLTNEGLLKTLAAVIDARDVFLYGHSLQASKYAGQVARNLGLDDEEIRTTELGALLHDIGKIGIKDSILNKPAKLTVNEYTEIKAHAQIGYDLLINLPGFERVADVVRCHHERWDGAGYPRGLKGTEIPIGARIVSVVEAVEAMISDRPYRKGMTPDEVLAELARGAGTQWDADVVGVFARILSKDRKHLVMHNSALDVALSRAPLSQLLTGETAPVEDPGLAGLTATFNTADQAIFILDDEYHLVSMNPAAEALTGYVAADVEGREWSELCAAEELRRGIPRTFFGRSRHMTLTSALGATIDLEVTGTPLRTGSSTYWMVLANDVSPRLGEEPAAEREVRVDYLTQLATRSELEERAVDAMMHGAQDLTLVLIDLEGVKAINDSLGHTAGDHALRTFARILSTELRGSDVAARFGGDEFAIMIPGSASEAAARLIDRVASSLAERVLDLGFALDFSHGIAEWDGRESLAELVERASGQLESDRRERLDRIVRLRQSRGA